jgi:heme exporter protein A
MLTIDNLGFAREDKKIFSNLGLSLSSSSALIITGKNGCGKTSLLKIIAGISKAQAGKILWNDVDIETFRPDFNSDIQFLGHKNFLKAELTVLENLRFYARLNDSELALTAALNFFKLNEFAHTKVKKLSAGWQKRVMLAKLLCCPKTLWLLDEPSSNLDYEGKILLKGLIKTRVRENGVVILTTHDAELFDLGARLDLEDFT